MNGILGFAELLNTENVITSYSIHYTKLYETHAGLMDLNGLEFAHPGDESDDLICSDCHNGGLQ